MKNIATLSIVLLLLAAWSASNAQQVVSSAGGYFESENLSLSWTLGEPVTETFEGSGVILTQGFQQPYNFYLSQILNIPAGWSGVSGYIDPQNKGVENLFGSHIPDFIILASSTDFYYPSGGVNTIGDWNYSTGYKVKAINGFDVTLTGSKVENTEISLSAGWNLIPVLNSCGATMDLFASVPGLVIVKEIAGSNLFWPEYGIQTLESVQAGKAYMLMMTEGGTFNYPSCDGKPAVVASSQKMHHVEIWNEPDYTASSHVIAFPEHVLASANIEHGDIIGVFTPDGQCSGFTEVTGDKESLAVVAFSNDETLEDVNGFRDGEMLGFRIYRPGNREEIDLEVSYDLNMPNTGLFMSQGLSAVKSATLLAPGLEEKPVMQSIVYPNPSHGIFLLTLNHWPDNLQIMLMDSGGELIKNVESAKRTGGSALRLDFSYLPKGVYFLRLVYPDFTEFKKIIIN